MYILLACRKKKKPLFLYFSKAFALRSVGGPGSTLNSSSNYHHCCCWFFFLLRNWWALYPYFHYCRSAMVSAIEWCSETMNFYNRVIPSTRWISPTLCLSWVFFYMNYKCDAFSHKCRRGNVSSYVDVIRASKQSFDLLDKGPLNDLTFWAQSWPQ